MFKEGEFESKHGKRLPWKIECDDLTYGDMKCISEIILNKYVFSEICCLSNNMIPIADMIVDFRDRVGGLLVLDDVLTTGKTFTKFEKEYHGNKKLQGFAIFSRGECPNWVDALWVLDKKFKSKKGL